MFKFLFFLFFFFILLIFLLGFSFVRTILRFLFGTGSSNNSQRKQQQKTSKRPTPHKKIFNKDEGEYVDYEEVKD
ncbi:MAG: DUF4834 family protein [Tannerellaceae bacterium]|jgi:hypothetical protein|nr:DUF4834 family protein [Tannerellaceae bacterium]